ncbi:MAG: bifunctional hydroxymethylpyrimidine kinase/phosphomethylpyrimidine kinase [Anaerolineae bacterium]|nr:bifunctional hydroxymethylpyrimidine kinase/phosphomethylpyrimidine kinase [Anaerolineae bacterium]
MTIPCVLTIAASDPSGAAGVQADLKTFEARQVYGLSAITALSVQNSTRVYSLKIMEASFVAEQIKALTDDIAISAFKTGMLLRPDIIEVVEQTLIAQPNRPAIIDPVFVAGDGRRFVSDETIEAYKTRLFPRATLITPNLDEATILTGQPVTDVAAMREAAKRLHDLGVAHVLVKGGHLPDSSQIVDVLYDGQTCHEFAAAHLPVQNPRGTGCTFASCIAAELAKGAALLDAVATAKFYVTEALNGALGWQIGQGRGTLFHSVGRPPIRE